MTNATMNSGFSIKAYFIKHNSKHAGNASETVRDLFTLQKVRLLSFPTKSFNETFGAVSKLSWTDRFKVWLK